MSELPDDIKRALAELPRERQPSPALEDRVVRAVFRPYNRWLWAAAVTAAAAVLLFAITHPWSPPPAGNRYVMVLTMDSTYRYPPGGDLTERRAEYARWADSLASLGKLDLGGRLQGLYGRPDVGGLFLIRAANDSEAARIAATCPHYKYHGYVQLSRLVP